MATFARVQDGIGKPEIIPVGRPYSFFKFVETRFPKTFSLRRLLSQARMLSCRTMVVERIGLSDDLREESEDIEIRYGIAPVSTVSRLSFFTKEFKTARGLGTVRPDEFLGYAVIKHDVVSGITENCRIYEAAFHASRHPNNFIKGAPTWLCRIAGVDLSTSGYLYAQQNNMTNVCAHVALRTAAASFHSAGDMTYREMNKLVGIDHVGRKTGGTNGGLTSDEMVHILEAAGARCFVGDYTAPGAPVPFQKYIYGSIESGYPAVLFFGVTTNGGGYHAIPVFGHTLNEDTWVPNADFMYFKIGAGTRYIPSESWLSMFVAHDDNWGANYCIPRGYIHARQECNRLQPAPQLCPETTAGVAYAISTFPKHVRLSSIRAEAIGADYLFTILPQLPQSATLWDKRLEFFANLDMLVLRPILVRGSEYIAHLASIRDWDGRKIRQNMLLGLKQNLKDETYWLVELSVPELFSANHRKVGEVLIRAEVVTGKGRDFRNYVLTRLPGWFALYDGGGANKPRYRFVETGAQGHVELYGTLPQPVG
jgi:hypothetical protein